MTDGFERSFGAALVTALLAGVAGVAGSYALAGYTRAFVAAPITSFLTQNVPAALLRFAKGPLTQIGQQFGISHLGQRLNLLLALALGTALFASLALAALATGRRLRNAFVPAGLAGGLVWLAATVVTRAPVTALGAGVASGVVVAIAVFAATVSESGDTSVSDGRREVLGSLAGALGVGVLGYVLGTRGGAESATRSTTQASTGSAGNASATGDGSVQQLLAKAESKSFGIEGLEGLVSGEDFYEVDTANVNPDVNAADWTLSVTGEVENEQTFDYEQIRSMESEHRFMTLRCVSDPLNGKKMDNALWQGVPMTRFIEDANPQGEYVMLRSVDGYYEEFPVESLRTGMIAYGKDGDVLPRQHGYPARALIPGHWGEINVKWIDEIEILDRPAKGFWEKRGWHGTGPVNTVAKLHATNQRNDGRVTVAGHANAGVRGIKRVEVSTDGGTSWNEARLSDVLEPNLKGDVWQQWAYTYQPPAGEHEVVVRAVDGTGTVQPREDSGPYPRGASGWVSKTING